MISKQCIINRRIIWCIGNFLKRISDKDADKDLTSDSFEILLDKDETLWNLRIGFIDNGFCGFFLENESNITDIVINLKVAVKNSENQLVVIKEEEWTCDDDAEKNKCFGWHDFMSISEILKESNNYLSNKLLTLAIDIEMYLPCPKYEVKTHSKGLLSEVVKKYFNSYSFNDFTIVCSDGRAFPAHRAILAARSTVFEAMLSNEMTEKKTNKLKVEDIDGDTMFELLKFIYTEKVEGYTVNAKKLIYAAEKYNLQELKSICAMNLIKAISEENVFETILLADRYDEQMLLKKCMLFIESKYDELEDRDEWTNIGFNLTKKIMNFLRDCSDIIYFSDSFD